MSSDFVGRGSSLHPPNRFERIRIEDDWEHLTVDDVNPDAPKKTVTQYFWDDTQTLITQNDSPDVGFRYSVNPYRGCAHGCSYCYARPGHEYLGMNAGLDFETKVLVKREAPRLFREFLARPQWNGATIMFSGVTDCYQPAERQFRLTRGCLEVAAEARQPIAIVTKNALVVRDLELLRELAAHQAAAVQVSLTTLNAELSRKLEPRTSTPTARLRAITELRAAGVPVGVMVAPVIPGLNDVEIPAILAAAAEAGAMAAGRVLLRLPHTVRPVFLDWLARHLPEREATIVSRIRACRDGALSDSQFGRRMRGAGPLADQIEQTFRIFRHKHALAERLPPLSNANFRTPRTSTGQMQLF